MHIARLSVSQFRNIQKTDLEFAPQVNWILGNNGSGKTSLLEAVYFLGHAKSFRTPHSTQLIQHQQKTFLLFAEIQRPPDLYTTIGIQREKHSETVKLAKQLCQRKSELAKALPMQVINPDVHKILEDSPRYRRRFLDWGVFHVEHSYWDCWRRYHSILKQRNAALKQHWDPKLIQAWDDELLQTVKDITTIKAAYVDRLRKVLQSMPHGFDGLQITYLQGWPESQPFEECLHSSLESDRKTGFTKFGPHRSDLKITVHGEVAKDVVSRGQQKFLACLLKIAQVEVFREVLNFSPLFLVDDLFSELDRQSAGRIIDLLQGSGSQLIVTAIETPASVTVAANGETKMFHVEHGEFTEVV